MIFFTDFTLLLNLLVLALNNNHSLTWSISLIIVQGTEVMRRPPTQAIIELELKDTTDTARSESYIDPHIEINSDGQLKMKFYYKR